jgi:hypothetical protein
MTIALLLALAAPLAAAAPPPPCPAAPAVLPADLAGWVHGGAVKAAIKPSDTDNAMLEPGIRADVALFPRPR